MKRTQKLLDSFDQISHLSPAVLGARFTVLQRLNLKLVLVLPLVDFSQAASVWSLAHRLASLSALVFWEVKSKAWNSILQQTNTGYGTSITVNRPRALKARAKGTDTDGRKSVFGQIYRQLHFIRPSTLRTARPWRVTFEGEGGTDAGGLFRDSISHMCEELESSAVPLFIPCPNARSLMGDNQEKWIPNPNCKSALNLSMYAFVGKLMVLHTHPLLSSPFFVWSHFDSLCDV